MTAVTLNKYVLFASAVYKDEVAESMRINPPKGWTNILTWPVIPEGFEAMAYHNDGQVVIAFSGTNALNDWYHANLQLGAGFPASQLKQAAAL